MPVSDPRQRRLARRRGADHAERLARLQLEVEAAAGSPCCCSGGTTVSWLTSTRRAGGAGRSASRCSGVVSSSFCRLLQPCRARMHQRPAADRLLDRRQRAAEQDRAGDHRAGAHLAEQHDIGAEAEHRRLQEEAEGLGQGGELADPVARGELRVERAACAASASASSTAPRMPSAWIISPCWRMVSAKASPCSVGSGRLVLGLAGQHLVEDGGDDQEEHAGQRQVPEIGMEAVDRDR